jgi:hypothetical protein
VWQFGKQERCTTVSVGKPGGKRPLGRPNCGWEDNIKMDHKEIGWFVVRMNVAGVNTAINSLVP